MAAGDSLGSYYKSLPTITCTSTKVTIDSVSLPNYVSSKLPRASADTVSSVAPSEELLGCSSATAKKIELVSVASNLEAEYPVRRSHCGVAVLDCIPASNQACESNSKLGCNVLSPLADIFQPRCGQLYPPGTDRLGRSLETDQNMRMQLEYFEGSPSPVSDTVSPATPSITNTKMLNNLVIKLKDGAEFVDKVLPPPATPLVKNKRFPPSYFVRLHEKVRLGGTYNYAGARVKLEHSKVNVEKFRELLVNYEDIGILQYLQLGFPLGLAQLSKPFFCVRIFYLHRQVSCERA